MKISPISTPPNKNICIKILIFFSNTRHHQISFFALNFDIPIHSSTWNTMTLENYCFASFVLCDLLHCFIELQSHFSNHVFQYLVWL